MGLGQLAPPLNSYQYSCAQPGFAGLAQNYTYSAATNQFALTGALACAACAENQFSMRVGADLACRQCGDFDANLVLLPGGNGSVNGVPVPCACAANYFSNAAATVAALRCTVCPVGATAPQGSTACTCSANFVASYSGAGALICTCPTGFIQSGAGPAALCGAIPTQTATMTSSSTMSSSSSASATMTSSATSTSSSSATATSTSTSTASLTSTGSLTSTSSATSTATGTSSSTKSATASATASGTATATGTLTATPSQTPSPSTVPDVLLFFGVDLIPSGTTITPSQVAAQPGALAQAAASFAALLMVAPANVYAVNVSDRATGAWTTAGLRSVRIRRLQAPSPSKAPGGVTVTFVVRLGKVPTQASVMNMSAVLSSPLASRAMGVTGSALSAALGLPASSVGASISSVALQYAPFAISADGTTTTINTSSTTLSPGGIVGAAIGAVVVSVALAVGVWARRSYAKHGKLPWTRDRKKELFARKSREAEVYEVENALAEAEKALEERESARFGGGAAAAPKPKGKRSKSAVVKQLLEKEAEQARELAAAAREKEAKDAEVAALRAQLKEAKKEENDDEVAELKRQLREAKEAQAQQAAWQAQMQAWAAAQQAAPTQAQEAP